MSVLLDANVLIAVLIEDHVHHDAAAEWFSSSNEGFATCPITQGSLMRFLLRAGQSAHTASGVIQAVANADRHEFWPDSISFADVRTAGVIGHRQVTDAYLAQLTRSHHGLIATFDTGLAGLHHDVAVLIEHP